MNWIGFVEMVLKMNVVVKENFRKNVVAHYRDVHMQYVCVMC